MKTIIDKIRNNRKFNSFFNENKDMLIKVAAAAIVVVAAFLFFLAKGENHDVPEIKDDKETAAVTEEIVNETVFIDIGGEVNEPKVTELPEGSRVEDAIKAAGGITDDADMSNINRAAFVSDGEKIFIPSKEADSSNGMAAASGSSSTASGSELININTADSTQLQLLNGVGPATAEKIISYREENGGFKSIEDIKNVSGIGDKTYEKLKDYIKV